MISTEPIVIERVVAVPPEVVWPYFSQGALWSLWQGQDCTIDPVPGGRFSVRLKPDVVASGEVIEVQENSRLVFTFGWTGGPAELPPGSTTVEISLIPEPPDGTRIRLTHSGLPGPLTVFNQSGWERCLGDLVQILDHGSAAAPTR